MLTGFFLLRKSLISTKTLRFKNTIIVGVFRTKYFGNKFAEQRAGRNRKGMLIPGRCQETPFKNQPFHDTLRLSVFV